MANGWRTIGIGLLAITGVSTAATAAEDAEYVAEIEDYRVDRDDPDVVELGRLRFHVIRRGDRFGLRVKDPESPVRLEFKGLEYFPIDPAYRVTARFDAYDEPRAVQVAFTPHATCPLPPRGNRLAVAVRAGEKRYGDP